LKKTIDKLLTDDFVCMKLTKKE